MSCVDPASQGAGRDPRRREILGVLERRSPWRAPGATGPSRPGHSRAAVAVVCIADPATGSPDSVLLTRRAAHLARHPGQWAFPGGRIEPGESAQGCARRECHEEIGLELGAGALLGRLDDFVTRSGFVISPFLFWQEGLPPLLLDEGEVASVHVVPWREFDRPNVPRWRRSADGRALMTLPVEQSWVHAPTAAVLYQAFCLVWRLEWQAVRDAEQPRFAWR